MITEMPADITEVIGFDLGHGTSCLCRVTIDSSNKPEPVKIGPEEVILTAVATDIDGNTVIGEAAVLHERSFEEIDLNSPTE
jgi:hypothetical protein